MDLRTCKYRDTNVMSDESSKKAESPVYLAGSEHKNTIN